MDAKLACFFFGVVDIKEFLSYYKNVISAIFMLVMLLFMFM